MLMENPSEHQNAIAEMRADLLSLLTLGTDGTISINGQYNDPREDRVKRLPNTLSVNFPGVTGEQLLAATPSVCASTGAACHSGQTNMSDTLRAIGLTADVAQGTVRLSLGWFTTPAEILAGATELIKSWKNITATEH